MTLEGREFHNLLNPGHRVGAEHSCAGSGCTRWPASAIPARFFRHLQRLGLDFVAHAFPDHHAFRAADLAFAGADAIVMTEKDAVKCEAFADAKRTGCCRSMR